MSPERDDPTERAGVVRRHSAALDFRGNVVSRRSRPDRARCRRCGRRALRPGLDESAARRRGRPRKAKSPMRPSTSTPLPASEVRSRTAGERKIADERSAGDTPATDRLHADSGAERAVNAAASPSPSREPANGEGGVGTQDHRRATGRRRRRRRRRPTRRRASPAKAAAPPKTESAKTEAAPKSQAMRRPSPPRRRTKPKRSGGQGARRPRRRPRPADRTGCRCGAFKDPETAKRVATKLREENFKVEQSRHAQVSAAAAAAPRPRPRRRRPWRRPGDQYDVFVSGMSAVELTGGWLGQGAAGRDGGRTWSSSRACRCATPSRSPRILRSMVSRSRCVVPAVDRALGPRDAAAGEGGPGRPCIAYASERSRTRRRPWRPPGSWRRRATSRTSRGATSNQCPAEEVTLHRDQE